MVRSLDGRRDGAVEVDHPANLGGLRHSAPSAEDLQALHRSLLLFVEKVIDIVGRVLTQCKRRHRHQEFLQFLRYIDEHVPADLDVHLVVDNYATHKHAKIKRWLAARSRYHLHYPITQKAIRRGSFTSVSDLVARIETFRDRYNPQARPFVWTATADSIFDKVQRICHAISGTPH